MIIKNSAGLVLAEKGSIADTFFSRLKGLLGRKDLPKGEGLVITRCNSVHMFFMAFPIDVAFVDRAGRVVGECRNLVPGSVSPLFKKAQSAVEVPVGTLDRTDTKLGDRLYFE